MSREENLSHHYPDAIQYEKFDIINDMSDEEWEMRKLEKLVMSESKMIASKISTWIIAMASSDDDGMRILRFLGTADDVKEKLVSIILWDKNKDEENWLIGSDNVWDIQDISAGFQKEFYGFGTYSDYFVRYIAKELSSIATI